MKINLYHNKTKTSLRKNNLHTQIDSTDLLETIKNLGNSNILNTKYNKV